MHGILFQELKEFIRKKLGVQSWEDVRKESGVETTLYVPVQSYPDKELMDIVGKVAEHMGTSAPAILEEFGKFFINSFMKSRSYLIEPQWDLLSMLEHSDTLLKAVITKRLMGDDPPTVLTTRDAPDQLTLRYCSKRKLCAFVKGILKGLAHHYRTEITITEPRCMLKGQAECELIIHVKASSKTADSSQSNKEAK